MLSARSVPVLGASLQCRCASLATSGAPEPDVIIIGAGVIGASIAVSLARRGIRTLNLDKGPGAGSGSTSYSSGICRPYYTALESAKFAWEGYHYYANWAEHVGADAIDDRGLARLRECGSLLPHTPASESFLQKVCSHMDVLGVPYEEWSAEKARASMGWDLQSFSPPRRADDPLFGTPEAESSNGGDAVGVRGAVYFPRSGYVSDPQLATYNLQQAAKATGLAEFRYGTQVSRVLKDAAGERVTGVGVRSGGGGAAAEEELLHAPVIVNAAGPYSSQVTAMAFDESAAVPNDMSVTTRAMRQEVAYVPSPPGIDYENEGYITADPDLGVYWRPEVGGKVLIGGAEPACDVPEYVDDPDDCPLQLTDNWTSIVYRAGLRLPSLAVPNTAAGIVAMYDVTEDWIPIYDRSSLSGYYMAIGTSGNQFKNAGVAGKLMAELIVETENSGRNVDEKPLQFELDYTGHVLDASIFSRRRVQADSLTSGTVLG